VHGWDLARGTGGDERLPADAVAHVLGYVRERADEIARSGAFSPPVPTDASDEQTQLLALLGRRARMRAARLARPRGPVSPLALPLVDEVQLLPRS